MSRRGNALGQACMADAGLRVEAPWCSTGLLAHPQLHQALPGRPAGCRVDAARRRLSSLRIAERGRQRFVRLRVCFVSCS